MRPTAAQLFQTSVRLHDLNFPCSGTILGRTRLVFVHLDQLISFGKNDRDGRVDSYFVGYLPDEVVLLFFLDGELATAASLGTGHREVIPVATALRRLRSETERGQAAYCLASAELLELMHASCEPGSELRWVDERRPEAVFPALVEEGFTGTLEFISNGRVSYLRFADGAYQGGHLCDCPEGVPVHQYVESLFRPDAEGAQPAIAGSLIRTHGPLPVQAPPRLIQLYRELYAHLASAVEREVGEGDRRTTRASTSLMVSNPVMDVVLPDGFADPAAVVVTAPELTRVFAAWVTEVLTEVEVVAPGGAIRILREVARPHRHQLHAAGFFERLPWALTFP